MPTTRPAVWRVFLAGLLAIVASIALAFMAGEALLPENLRNSAPAPVAAVLSLLGYAATMRWLERRKVEELKLASAPGELIGGILLGIGIALACLLPLAALGNVAWLGFGDPSSMAPSAALMVLVATSEELLTRGLIFRLAEQLWGTAVALLVSVAFFVVAHLPGDHISALGLAVTGAAGAGFAATYLLTRRLWLPIGVHFAWNFLFDGVFSIPVSGHEPHGWLKLQLSGPDWLSGGAYGIEASAISLAVWTCFAIAALLVAARRRPHANETMANAGGN